MTASTITQLRVCRYHHARNITLDLHPRLTVLIGENGSGKSTLLDALSIPVARALRCHVSAIRDADAGISLSTGETYDTYERNEPSQAIVKAVARILRGSFGSWSVTHRSRAIRENYLRRALEAASVGAYRKAVVRARLGLDEFDDFAMPPDGHVGLIRANQVTSYESLSAGEQAYLDLVGMCAVPDPSLIVIDDVEAHLHPGLIGRVMAMLEDVEGPVLLTTHSDVVLDAVPDPAASIVLCARDADAQRNMVLRRPDARLLADWLATDDGYSGVGRLRAAGYLSHLFADDEPRRS